MRTSSWGRGTTLAALVFSSSSSLAQPAETPPARADRLFKEGRALVVDGKYSEACPKLAESQQLDPATGTLLALALCHQGQGWTASAWRELHQVLDAALRDNRADRAKFAREQIAAIEPTLSKLTVVVADPAAATKGLHVERDAKPLDRTEWGRPVPVDPGTHVVAANAPGKKPWSTQVEIAPQADARIVLVPALDDANAQAPPASSSAAPAESTPPSSIVVPSASVGVAPSTAKAGHEQKRGASARRTAGFAVGGVGIIALGIGAFFGVTTYSESSQARNLCPQPTCTNQQGLSADDAAKRDAWIADFGVGLGIVGVGVGILMIATGGEKHPQAAHIAPLVGRDVAGVALGTTW